MTPHDQYLSKSIHAGMLGTDVHLEGLSYIIYYRKVFLILLNVKSKNKQ